MSRTEPLASTDRYGVQGATIPYVAEHGVVYTRPWVADLVLDLAGYTPEANLVDAGCRGAFLRKRRVPRVHGPAPLFVLPTSGALVRGLRGFDYGLRPQLLGRVREP